tara:strand:+ start:37 stop:660 length:624 start_codon:yes stop_codon:yes gene_type:complete
VAIISNAVTIADAGAFSVSLGSMTHIKTLTASSSANLTFVHGSASVVLDSTYPVYVFKYINIHPSGNGHFTVNFRDGGSNYDATKTSTFFHAYHYENGSEEYVEYASSSDLGNSTGAQRLFQGNIDTSNDSSVSGEMFLFNPSSTTFVKHFISINNGVLHDGSNVASRSGHASGYCNVTAAIDGVQFAMSTGNIDSGTIKLYGLKDS